MWSSLAPGQSVTQECWDSRPLADGLSQGFFWPPALYLLLALLGLQHQRCPALPGALGPLQFSSLRGRSYSLEYRLWNCGQSMANGVTAAQMAERAGWVSAVTYPPLLVKKALLFSCFHVLKGDCITAWLNDVAFHSPTHSTWQVTQPTAQVVDGDIMWCLIHMARDLHASLPNHPLRCFPLSTSWPCLGKAQVNSQAFTLGIPTMALRIRGI